MKANDGSGDIEERDSWRTPQALFMELHSQYLFDFDCCATSENNKTYLYSSHFETVEAEIIKDDTCWMNPPFSKSKEMFEHFFKVVAKGVSIYRCDNFETVIWQDVIFKGASWVFVPKGRVCYEGMEGKGSRFPSALIGLNVEPPKGLQGVLLWIKK